MKTAFIVLLTLFSLVSNSQAIPKGANMIVVKEVGFNQVVNTLLDLGYFIDKKDSEFETVITQPRAVDNGVWSYFVQVRVKDSTAYVSGQLKVKVTPFGNGADTYSQIEYRGMKGSPNKEGFSKLEDIAKALKGTVSYIVQ